MGEIKPVIWGKCPNFWPGFQKKTNKCLKAPGWPKPCQKRVHGGPFYGLVVLPPQHGVCNPAYRNVVQAGLIFGKFALRCPASAGNAVCRSLAASVPGREGGGCMTHHKTDVPVSLEWYFLSRTSCTVPYSSYGSMALPDCIISKLSRKSTGRPISDC